MQSRGIERKEQMHKQTLIPKEETKIEAYIQQHKCRQKMTFSWANRRCGIRSGEREKKRHSENPLFHVTVVGLLVGTGVNSDVRGHSTNNIPQGRSVSVRFHRARPVPDNQTSIIGERELQFDFNSIQLLSQCQYWPGLTGEQDFLMRFLVLPRLCGCGKGVGRRLLPFSELLTHPLVVVSSPHPRVQLTIRPTDRWIGTPPRKAHRRVLL